MRIADRVRTSMAAAGAGEADVGVGTAVLEIYDGAIPGAIGDVPAGTLLVSFDLQTPAFAPGAAGVETLQGVPIAAVGVGDGTATYARVLDKDGVAIYDTSDVGTSGNTVTMSTTSVSTGLDVNLNSFTLTQPAGTV